MPKGVYKRKLQPFKWQERFWSRFSMRRKNCWNWRGYITRYGYGRFWFDNTSWLAHRFAFQIFNGPVPSNLEIDHLCRNRKCVNPSHLELVTSKENMLRGDGLAVRNKAKIHCAQGHPFSTRNTYHPPYWPTRRVCRICRNRWANESHKKAKERILAGKEK